MIAILTTLASPVTVLGSGTRGMNIPIPVSALKGRQMNSGPEVCTGVRGVVPVSHQWAEVFQKWSYYVWTLGYQEIGHCS